MGVFGRVGARAATVALGVALSAALALPAGCSRYAAPGAGDRPGYQTILWADDAAEAAVHAEGLGMPILLVLAAGARDGECTVGPDRLRKDALAAPEVVERLNRTVVPVWVDVRSEPVPAFGGRDRVLEGLEVDGQGWLGGWQRRGTVLRVAVLSPDRTRLLSDQGWAVRDRGAQLARLGYGPYEPTRAGDLLAFVEAALAAAPPPHP